MIRVGDKLEGVFPSTFAPEDKRYNPSGSWPRSDRKVSVEARVYYIHPQLRYVTIEFKFAHGATFRECRRLRIRRKKHEA